ncbi:MAG: tetratricopeptide repeat protein [Campylobacteraceae bacterium]
MANKEKGIDSFYKKNFNLAQFYFSLALGENEEDEELKLFLLLSGIAKEKEEDAFMILDLYKKSKDKNISFDFDMIDRFLKENEKKEHKIFDEINSVIEGEDGIIFDDFLTIMRIRGEFKKAFEDTMCSTKLIISRREDFVMFLNLLLDNGYQDMSLGYIEKALSLFPTDKYFQGLLIKASKESI